MAVRKQKPIEERDPYAAMVLSAFDELEKADEVGTAEGEDVVDFRAPVPPGIARPPKW